MDSWLNGTEIRDAIALEQEVSGLAQGDRSVARDEAVKMPLVKLTVPFGTVDQIKPIAPKG
ncbi:MAG: hypothetical protein ACRDEA_06130 [Microcystaceae cyanobacterium]